MDIQMVNKDVAQAGDAIAALLDTAPEPGEETPDSTSESAPESQPESAPDAAPDGEQPESAPIETKPKYKVKVQGDEMEVDIDELVNGYQREADYRKKTAELARQRSEVEALKTQNDPKVISEFQQQISRYQQLLGEQITADGKQDWQKLLQENPIEYLRQKELAEQRMKEWNDIQTKRQTEQETQYRQSLTTEAQQLFAKRPEWKEEATWNADREKISNFLQNTGYSKQEVNSVIDHRALIVADKARRYDELMAQKNAEVKKLEKLPPKTEKPGSSAENRANPNKEAMSKLRKTGTIDDAAEALTSLLG